MDEPAKKRYRVTLSKVLDDLWGADECMRDCGEAGLIELLHEDLAALLDDMEWTIEEVKDDR